MNKYFLYAPLRIRIWVKIKCFFERHMYRFYSIAGADRYIDIGIICLVCNKKKNLISDL